MRILIYTIILLGLLAIRALAQDDPTSSPTGKPSSQPSAQPTVQPSTAKPSGEPSGQPSGQPSGRPSSSPTKKPTVVAPTAAPSPAPSPVSTSEPTVSNLPSLAPTMAPVPETSVDFVKLEVRQVIQNCSFENYQSDSANYDKALKEAIVESIDSEYVTLPNLLDFEVHRYVIELRRRLASEDPGLSLKYNVITSVASMGGSDSPPSSEGLANALQSSLDSGDFTANLRAAASTYGATFLQHSSSDREGFSVQYNGEDHFSEDDDDGNKRELEAIVLAMFVLLVAVIMVVFSCCAGNRCCKKGNADNMSLADRARAQRGGGPGSPGGLFSPGDADDLEMTWVQTDTGLVRTTRRRSDLIQSPLGGKADRYRGIDSADSVPSATPMQDREGRGIGSQPRGAARGRGTPSASQAGTPDPFSSEQPIMDLFSGGGGASSGSGGGGGTGVSVSPSTGTMLPRSGAESKISINLRGAGIGSASRSAEITRSSRQQQDDGLDDFLSIAARSDNQRGQKNSSSDDHDGGMLF